jgi:hypothetical protein
VWAEHIEVQHGLQCPTHGEKGTQSAVQHFQHGLMIWVAQDSSRGDQAVYVFVDDSTYQRFDDPRPADPAVVASVPSGFYAIGDKFGAIYWEGTGARVQQRLGKATTPQTDSAGAFQQFSRGRMFWLGAIDRIFVVYDAPGGWISFEDTF